MQKVLSDLKTDDGRDFAEVYIDDVLIFCKTLEEHLQHIRLVLEQLKKAGLKLKPAKCHFLSESVEYLGHLITPQGLKPNPKQVQAAVEFPVPESVTNVHQFLGLTSYYRRFIAQFDRADALSRNPVNTQQDNHLEVGAQVAQVTSASEKDVSHLLQEEPAVDVVASNFHLEQKIGSRAKNPLSLS